MVNNVKTGLSVDARYATFTVDLLDPKNLPLTSKGKSHLAASARWTEDETTGLRYTLAVVLPFTRADELAAMQAEAAALTLAPAPEAVTEDKPAPRTRSRKAA